MSLGIRFRSVRQKLFAGVLLTSVAALLVMGISLFVYDLRTYRERSTGDLAAQADLIAHATSAALQFEDRKFATDNLALLRARPAIRAAALYNAKGGVFASYVREGIAQPGLPALPGADAVDVSDERLTLFRRIVSNHEILGTVYLQADYEVYKQVGTYTAIAASVTLVALVISLLLSSWLQASVTRPITAIASLARQVVERRDYSARAKRTTDDEIGALADSFNDMLAEIEHRTAALESSKNRLESEIAERAEANRALRTSEERYRSLVTASSQMVWTVEPDGQARAALPAWQAFTGQSGSEVLGTGWLDALHPEDAAPSRATLQQAFEAGNPFELEFRVRRADAAYRYFAARGVPVMREDGTLREWVGTCTDVHDRRLAVEEIRRLNEELEQRVRDRTAQLEESNRHLEAFSYSVSHDLRTPLRAIDGFGVALLEDFGDQVNEGMRRHIARIRSATSRMGQLIEDLLGLARISRVELAWKNVDLSGLARQVVSELQQRDEGRRVEVVVWDDVVALGDPRLLHIVVENLLGNAWKFTGKTEGARIELGILRDSDASTFFVRDNGAGFDMASADKLFDAFQRLHAVNEFPGTGIGLATVQRIVNRHAGRIWAHAQPGKGATFYFTLGTPERVRAATSWRESA